MQQHLQLKLLFLYQSNINITRIILSYGPLAYYMDGTNGYLAFDSLRFVLKAF